ncbi:hypothetical protein [Paraburkholderia terrae]|uniref:hypothetical protein n=1 Tax=Paraburkholderia terrae TaxID=311230 RepID=UPI0033656A52
MTGAAFSKGIMEGNMSDGKRKVTAHTPGSHGQFSMLAGLVRDATGAACVAMVVINAAGSGEYCVAGPLESQLLMPDLLEQAARELRTQLAGSVQ